MKKTLFTIALPEEKICLPESDDIKVVVTKVGKACSAYFLIKALYEYKPDIVINIGTAGTFNMNVGDIVVSNTPLSATTSFPLCKPSWTIARVGPSR